jgi:uncharacterized protein YcnI
LRTIRAVAATALAAGLIALTAGVAAAHVTIDPESVPQGNADATLTFRVPNENDTASTTTVKVQLPQDHPIAAVKPQVLPGWTSTVEMTHLTTPITTDDGTITDVASTITWTGGKIPPGEFEAFPVLASGFPTGVDSLTFKTLQTYDNGDTVSWIEVPDATNPNPENPAPTLTLTAAEPDAGGATATTEPGASTTSSVAAAVPVTTSEKTSSDDSTKTLAIVGLVVAVIGLIAAIVAIVLARKKPAPGARAAASTGSGTPPPSATTT